MRTLRRLELANTELIVYSNPPIKRSVSLATEVWYMMEVQDNAWTEIAEKGTDRIRPRHHWNKDRTLRLSSIPSCVVVA